jgi:hypothetical protein
MGRMWLLCLLAACGQSPTPDPAPTTPVPVPVPPVPVPVTPAALCAPSVVFSPPTREVKTPAPVEVTPRLERTQKVLERVVRDHGRDPNNPWAIGHAMLALGSDVALTNGVDATDWLFREYAQVRAVEGEPGLTFPASRGNIRIEPHTDLILKALTETGVPPDRRVEVAGEDYAVGDLYRGSLCRAWVEGESVAFQSWNDTPWALQGLATWAPPGLAWQADGGHAMTMDGFTHRVVSTLSKETAFMRDAMAAGRSVEKRRQGIFSYTCGGAHLLQGAAYAVARGFGSPADQDALRQEVEVLFWRLDLELGIYDQALKQAPEYRVVLLEQRMKFLGHFLETQHKLAATGLFVPSDPQRAMLDRALTELMATVEALESDQIFDNLDAVRRDNEQTYLDFIGDAAHAIRGIRLATGEQGVAL